MKVITWQYHTIRKNSKYWQWKENTEIIIKLHNQTSVNCHHGFFYYRCYRKHLENDDRFSGNRQVLDVKNRANKRKKKWTYSSKYKIELVNKVINRVWGRKNFEWLKRDYRYSILWKVCLELNQKRNQQIHVFVKVRARYEFF